MNNCITTTKQSTTKPCAYFLGYTVCQVFINEITISAGYDLEACGGLTIVPTNGHVIFERTFVCLEELTSYVIIYIAKANRCFSLGGWAVTNIILEIYAMFMKGNRRLQCSYSSWARQAPRALHS